MEEYCGQMVEETQRAAEKGEMREIYKITKKLNEK